jgi:acyl-CoA dehydrogenase
MNRTPEQKAEYLPKVASGALNETKTCARDREQLGKAMGEFQLIQAMLADSHRTLIRIA